MVVLSLKNHLRSHLQLPPGQRLVRGRGPRCRPHPLRTAVAPAPNTRAPFPRIQRLFYNSEPLADYDSVKDLMEDAATTRPCHVLRLTLGLAKKRPRPPGHAALDVLVKTPAEGDLADAVAAVRGAIAGGMRPERAFEGSGGTYFLRECVHAWAPFPWGGEARSARASTSPAALSGR